MPLSPSDRKQFLCIVMNPGIYRGYGRQAAFRQVLPSQCDLFVWKLICLVDVYSYVKINFCGKKMNGVQMRLRLRCNEKERKSHA